MSKQREPLPGQLELPFGTKLKTFKKTAHEGGIKYDALQMQPIETCALAAYKFTCADGTNYIQLWSYGSTISEARKHFKRIHPEHKKFTVGILGVGEYIVDQVEHGWVPDSRMLDQDGVIVLNLDGRP